jgi:hypothetical protein
LRFIHQQNFAQRQIADVESIRFELWVKFKHNDVDLKLRRIPTVNKDAEQKRR